MPQGMPYDLFVQVLRETFPEDFRAKTPKQVVDDWEADYPELRGVLDQRTRFILEGTEGLPEIQQREFGVAPPASKGPVGGVSGLPPAPVSPYGRQPSTVEQVGLLGARVVPALAGAVVAGAGTYGTGAIAGGAGGAMAGEALAEGYEEATGIAPGSHANLLAQTAIGAIPVTRMAAKVPLIGPYINKAAQSILGRVALEGAEGAFQGAASTAAEIPLRYERPPGLGEVAFGAGVGSLFGGAIGGSTEGVRAMREVRNEGRMARGQLSAVNQAITELEQAGAAGLLTPDQRLAVTPFLTKLFGQIEDPALKQASIDRVENLFLSLNQQDLRQQAAAFVTHFKTASESMGLYERLQAAKRYTDALRAARADEQTIEETASILAGLTPGPEPAGPKLLPAAPPEVVARLSERGTFGVPSGTTDVRQGPFVGQTPDSPPLVGTGANEGRVIPPGAGEVYSGVTPPARPSTVDFQQAVNPPTMDEIRQRAIDESPGAGVLTSPAAALPPPYQPALRLKVRSAIDPPELGDPALSGPMAPTMRREGLETLPRVQRGEITAEQAFHLNWIAKNLEDLPHEDGAIIRGSEEAGAKNANVRVIDRTPGTPILFGLRALADSSEKGRKGALQTSRATFAREIRAYLEKPKGKPNQQVRAALKLADTWGRVYDSTTGKFDWNKLTSALPPVFDDSGRQLRNGYSPDLPPDLALTDWERQPRWLVEKYAPQLLADSEKLPQFLEDLGPGWTKSAPMEVQEQLAMLDDQELLAAYDEAVRYGGTEPIGVGWLIEEIQYRGLHELRQPPLQTEGPGSPARRSFSREAIEAERQPSLLPEVRETENATPALDAPFGLTPDVSQGPAGQQQDLFGVEPPRFGEKPATPAGKKALPSLFDDERGAAGRVLPPNLPGTGRPARAVRNLTFAGQAFDDLQRVAKAGAGREVSGLLLGYPDGGIARVVEIPNSAADPSTTFAIAPEAFARVLQQARKEGLEVLASYHTQPTGSAMPSKADLRGSVADLPLVILGMDGGDLLDARVWQPGRNRQWAEGQLAVATIRNPQTPPAFQDIRDVKRFVRSIPRLRSGPADVAGLTEWFSRQQAKFGNDAWFTEAQRLLDRGQSREAWLKVQQVTLLGERAARAGLKQLPDPELSKQGVELVESLARGGSQDPVGALFALYDGRTVHVPGVGRVVTGPDIPPALQGGDTFVGPGGLLRPGDRHGKIAQSLSDGTMALEITKGILADANARAVLNDPTGASATRLFRQVTEQFMLNPANFKAVQALTASGKLTLEEVAQQYQFAISQSARQLAALSVWKRKHGAEIRQIEGITGAAGEIDDLLIRGKGGVIVGRLGDLTTKDTFAGLVRPTRAWDRAMLINDLTRGEVGAFSALESASRGFMISQWATAARNLWSAGIRLGAEQLDLLGEVVAAAAAGHPGKARAAWQRLAERATIPYQLVKDGAYVTPWRARQEEFAAIYEGVSGTSGRLLTLMDELQQAAIDQGTKPQDIAHLLGGIAYGEATPHRTSKHTIINAVTNPKLQNFLTMFNRAQEFTVRAGIYTAEMRAGLRAAGVDPRQIDGWSAAKIAEAVGGERALQDLIHNAVHQSLNFSFAGELITKGFGKDVTGSAIGSMPAYLVQQLNKLPYFRAGYPFPRFNLSAAPRFLWDHSIIGLALDPLYAKTFKRGRFFLGQKAGKHLAENIPEANRAIALHERELGDALMGRLTLKRRLQTYDKLIARGEKALAKAATAPLPGLAQTQKQLDLHRAEAASLRAKLGTMDAQVATAQDQLKRWKAQKAELESTVKQAVEANVPMDWNTLVARNLVGGGALLGAAYLVRTMEGAEGTPWYILKVPKPFGNPGETIELDFRPFAPFAQYLFVADVLKDAFEYTDWSAVAEDWERDGTIDWYSRYQGKYTMSSLRKEIAGAFLSMSQVAGTTLALTDLVLGSDTVPALSSVTEGFMRVTGSFLARFTIPFAQLKAVTDLVDDDESKARIAEGVSTEGVAGQTYPLAQPLGNLPFLGALLIPETVSQITGKPLDTYAPLMRALTGVTMRERTQLQDVLTESGVPPSSVYLRDTGDPFLDRLLGFHYANTLNRVLPQLLDNPVWQALPSPALRRDFLQQLLPKVKASAIAQAMADSDPEQLQGARDTREGQRRRLRMEKLRELIDAEGLRNKAGEPEADTPPELDDAPEVEPEPPPEAGAGVIPPQLGAAAMPQDGATGYSVEPPRFVG